MGRSAGLTPEQVREFEFFFASTKARTLLAILSLVRDLGEAEDVLQIAYERAAMHWARIRTYEDPAGWVRRVAYNEAVSWLRRVKRQPVDYRADISDVGGQHVDSYEHELPELLVALRQVPHRDRVVLTLRYVWRYSVDEIAAELSLSPNTVKARLARARRRLAAVAGEWEETRGDSGSGASGTIPARGRQPVRVTMVVKEVAE